MSSAAGQDMWRVPGTSELSGSVLITPRLIDVLIWLVS